MHLLLSEENAKMYFEQLHKTDELTEDELDNVVGGGCYYSDGRLIVTDLNCCEHFVVMPSYSNSPNAHSCNFCQYVVFEHGLNLCNNWSNREK